MNILKRLLVCLCLTYGIGVKADETNVRVMTPLTPKIISTAPQLISMSTREVRMFPPLIDLNKEGIPKTTLREVVSKPELTMIGLAPPRRQPTNAAPSEEVMALSRTLSRASEESEGFPLSKRLSFGLSRTEPEVGGVRASFIWKFKR